MSEYFVIIVYTNKVYFCNFGRPFEGPPKKSSGLLSLVIFSVLPIHQGICNSSTAPVDWIGGFVVSKTRVTMTLFHDFRACP